MIDDTVVRRAPVRRPVIPELNDDSLPPALHDWVKKVIEAVGVLTGQVAQTDDAALDQAVTFRDLIDSGIAIQAPESSDKFIVPNDGSSNLQAPPAPTGFVVIRLPFNMRLTWNAPTYANHGYTEVWRNADNNLSTATLVSTVPDGINLYEDGYLTGQAWYYWIRFVSKAGVVGGFYSLSGTSDSAQPGDVTNLTSTLEGFAIRLRWNPVVVEDIADYEVRLGNSWGDSTLLANTLSTYFVYPVQVAGTYRFWVRARDVTGFYSGTATSIDVVVAAPATVAPSSAIVGDTLVLSWQTVAGAFAIDRYEVRYGTDYATSTLMSLEYTTSHTLRVNWGGTRKFWITAIDVAGNYGVPASVDVTIASPGPIQSLAAEVVDNNVLLRWTAPITGSLLVATYEILKGASIGAAVLIGDKSGLFTSVFEQAAGTYTYWVRARDSAGNVGSAVSISAVVNQPPDYVLYDDDNWLLSLAALSSALLEPGQISLPINTTETYGDHFSTRGYASPQAQIDAGYPIYAQPVPTSGYAEWEMDYGAVIPATSVLVTPTIAVAGGAPSYSIDISYKLNLGDAYSAVSQGNSLFISSPFRYVKIRLNANSNGGAGLYALSVLNVKLNTKQKRVDFFGTCNAGDAGGTRFLLTASQTEVVLTGNNTSGQDTITGLSTTANLAVNMSVEGTGIQGGTVIKSIDSSTQVTLSKVTTSGTTGGTYSFGMSAFVDLFGPPLIQPKGTTPIIPVVDFVDAPNPLSFKVLLFNDSGARVSADIGWQARGV